MALTFKEKCKRAFSDFVHTQTVEWTSVAPRQNFAKNRFFLICPAGILIYKPKGEADISRFRDKWVSTFDTIAKVPNATIREIAFFRLFREIRESERVSWKANLKTRMKYWQVK